MANIRTRTDKSGKTYHTVQIRLKGYPPQTASFNRLTDARKWAQLTEAAIKEGRHFKTTEAKKHTVSDLIDRYVAEVLPTKPKKSADRKHQLAWWRDKIGAYLLSDITPSLLAQYRDELSADITQTGKPRSPATIVQYMTAISPAFNLAVSEWEWLSDSPMRKVKKPSEPRGRVRYLDDDERQRLLTSCKGSPNKLLYPAFILSLSTGMRLSETMNLYWKEPSSPPTETAWGVVNLAESCVILHATKNGDRRRVPLANQALIELQKLGKVRRLDTQLVFPSPTQPQKPIELKKSWINALKRAEVDNFRWHDLRHCTASYLAMNGASLAEIAEVLGHKTLSMVKRYSHLSDGHVSNVVASMNDKIFGGVL
ncbi:MAG: site-specific integrase [Methylococcaceae bacterium]|nr:site-specific integrase [Methylococcaceae bacterium]